MTLDVDAEALALWDVNSNTLKVEPGKYVFEVGRSSSDIAKAFPVHVGGKPFATVDASKQPINVFDHSFAASDVAYRESAKATTVAGLRADKLVGGYYVVGGRSAGAWTAINDIDLSRAKTITVSLGSTSATPAGVELRLGSPTGKRIASFTVSNTGESAYSIPGAVPEGDIPVRELAFENVAAKVTQKVSGIQDLYVVFTGKDVRIRDLKVN